MNTDLTFDIDCTGDACTGDKIEFTEAVFYGSYRKPKYSHDRTIIGTIIKDSYGEQKQQHTFTIEVIDCDDAAIKQGTRIRRKGRNVYRNGTTRAKWADESARQAVLDEKHERGASARADRDARREFECRR